jgi:hypothetical protein
MMGVTVPEDYKVAGEGDRSMFSVSDCRELIVLRAEKWTSPRDFAVLLRHGPGIILRGRTP